MSRKTIAIVGSGIAGYAAALGLAELLRGEHEIIVLDKSADFVFTPSLTWYPFDLRKKDDISFDVRPVYDKHGISFNQTLVTGFDLDGRQVLTTEEPVRYDFLLIATGPHVDFDNIPGLGPHRHSLSICSLEHAEEAKHAWELFLKDPGPIVIGAAQGSACYGAACEFLFNVRYQLEKQNLHHEAPITYVTAEEVLEHFGFGDLGTGRSKAERMFRMCGIETRANARIREVTENGVSLESGEFLPSKFTMIIPRFVGVEAVRATPGLANGEGFIRVDERARHPEYPNVYAAGAAVRVPPPGETHVACGLPEAGFPSERMGETAARNIAAEIQSGERKTMPRPIYPV
ncbi:MAG: FAD-dependent oxidoreductase [Gemmatimonadetes bacterium]|nr:FAD-dependent oxidoreductase [Gemmatimonadota bacterium]